MSIDGSGARVGRRGDTAYLSCDIRDEMIDPSCSSLQVASSSLSVTYRYIVEKAEAKR